MSRSSKRSGDTDFGFQRVPLAEKARKVAGVFDSVARRYDLMNDVMSFGIHRLWKRFTVEMSAVKEGDRVLDLAGGTGDLAGELALKIGKNGRATLSDINAAMLTAGRQRLTDRGIVGNVDYVQADAEALPFPNNSYHCVTIAFGLRNVSDKAAALSEMHRVLKPGGRLLVLEFSKPVAPGLAPLYDAYSFKLIPLMGKLIADDAASYRYLAESIRMHPDQDSLKDMMIQAGLERCDYYNLSGGIVALHRGFKL